jgi:hypothetical protein
MKNAYAKQTKTSDDILRSNAGKWVFDRVDRPLASPWFVITSYWRGFHRRLSDAELMNRAMTIIANGRIRPGGHAENFSDKLMPHRPDSYEAA